MVNLNSVSCPHNASFSTHWWHNIGMRVDNHFALSIRANIGINILASDVRTAADTQSQLGKLLRFEALDALERGIDYGL